MMRTLEEMDEFMNQNRADPVHVAELHEIVSGQIATKRKELDCDYSKMEPHEQQMAAIVIAMNLRQACMAMSTETLEDFMRIDMELVMHEKKLLDGGGDGEAAVPSGAACDQHPMA